MRAVIYTVSSVILVLAGFLLTPGVFNIVNPEYLLALHQYGAPLDELRRNIGDNNSAIIVVDGDIASLEKLLAEQSAAAAAQQAKLSVENASTADMAKAAVDAGLKASSIGNGLGEAKKKKTNLEVKKEAFAQSEAIVIKTIEASKTDSVNLYTVTRALALGAIGALMSILAKFLSNRKPNETVGDEYSFKTIAASMAMGATVSVVVIGLFYTGFISIFANAGQISGNPDFWKVTILCLLAGTFSDRLFQAASARMEQYVQSAGRSAQTAGTRPVRQNRKAAANKPGQQTAPTLVEVKNKQ
jgi:hypothetical protein